MKEKYALIWKALENIDFGSVEITFPDGSRDIFTGRDFGFNAAIEIKNWKALEMSVYGGDVGFGESYMMGYWDSGNLPDLLSFFTHNASCLEHFFHAKRLQTICLAIRHFFNRNSKKGSKKNISKHYDLGNDFYQLWLDKSMTYSSAFFNDPYLSLCEAQKSKYQNIIDKLKGKTILEIGCGWGGFIEEANKANFQVTGLTLSHRQKEYCDIRHKNEILLGNINIKLQDYRDEVTKYDNIVSIEMFEAVGIKYWDGYFKMINNCLKDKGKALLQIITIDERVFKDYKNRVDFIQKHIFPGGVLPSKSKIRDLAKSNNLEVKSEMAFGSDYARTLKIWLDSFDKQASKIKDLGFDENFFRMWRFYLSYCIAGFLSKRTDVVQFELQKKSS